ncbi:hypothetical protein PAECIP111891_06704 [Paenibacillus allorhizoplanae]|uniref:Copper amine oxidase-like N-terminal domain-containing protein n=1 Tax=Paenibacillus allorhizoplanae TaxID=2905648 RepID=A0ABM9D057_9BACL|nr:stalk domain-containing protein [Paenibacillus allorhizoplanae]CAH1230632.1 hypothetical protein PAECIP111891_06704 [Paenibacillus allorhizoplanae]
MKKKLLIALGLSGIIAASVAVGAYAASDIKLFINGKLINADLQIVDGSSYVPLRVVSESLGADVKWDGDKREISISAKGFDPNSAIVTPSKSYNVKVNVTSGPMTMDISKVTLDPAYKSNQYSQPIKAVVLDVKTENTSNETLNWYVTQDKIVTNTKEQVSGYLYSEQVDGEFIGKVVKTGKIVFEIKGDLTSITSLNYVVEGPSDKNYKRVGETKTTEIILK